MKKQDDILPTPVKVKTPHEELQILAELQGTVYFTVLKRVARRYTENLKTMTFTLNPTDTNFAVKHTGYVENAKGMNLLIKIIENAQRELNKMEGEE